MKAQQPTNASEGGESTNPKGGLYWLMLFLATQVIGALISAGLFATPYLTIKEPSWFACIVFTFIAIRAWDAVIQAHLTGRTSNRLKYAYRESSPINFWGAVVIFLFCALVGSFFSYVFSFASYTELIRILGITSA